jgi:hypothetical protein
MRLESIAKLLSLVAVMGITTATLWILTYDPTSNSNRIWKTFLAIPSRLGLDMQNPIGNISCAWDYVQEISPLPLVIKNPYQIVEVPDPYDPKVEFLNGSLEDFIANWEDTNQLTERKNVPVLMEWFEVDPLSRWRLACWESETLCKALQIWKAMKLGSLDEERYVPGSGVIPKVIHQTAKKIPDYDQPDLIFSIRSFRRKNAGYIHLFWNDEDVDAFLKYCYPHLESLVQKIPFRVMKADLFRYLVVFKFGGIYSDADTLCLKSIDDWIQMESLTELNGKTLYSKKGRVEGLFGIESDLLYLFDKEPGRHLDKMFYPHPAGFAQFAFAASPGSPVLRDVVANTTQNLMYILALSPKSWQELQDLMGKMIVLELTGPGVVSFVVHDHLRKNSGLHWSDLTNLTTPFTADTLRIHPITAFCNSPVWQFMGQKHYSHQQALVRHLMAGSWN